VYVVHNNITKYLEWEVLTFVMSRMSSEFTWQNVTSSLEIGINAPWDKALFA